MEGRGGLVLAQALVFADPFCFRLQQFRDHPLVHSAGPGVHGHSAPCLQQSGRDAGVEQSRHMELAGQCGHVAGDAAEIGHDGRCLGHKPNEPGGRARGHQHRALRKLVHVSLFVHAHHRTGPHSRKGRVPPFQEQRVSFDRRCGCLVRGCCHAKRPRLEQPQTALLVHGPFDVLGAAEMGFDGDGHAGERQHFLITQARFRREFLRERFVPNPS